MKGIIAIILSFSLITISQGQVLSISNDSVVTGYANEAEIDILGVIHNNTGDTIQARWRKIESLPTGWASSVCDNIQCWVETVYSSPEPFKIPPHGQSPLEVHFYPGGIPGNGSVTVKAWVDGDSANTVITGTPKGAIALEPVGIGSSHESDRIRIYPNPAKDYILIKNLPSGKISTVEVYNIFGRKMLSFSQAPSQANSIIQKFDIGSLAKGIYMVRVFDLSLNVIFTKSLSKD